MNQHQHVDYIIVGQGLAGSAIALRLISRGSKIVVYDTPRENNSSVIAAGVYNPITGKNMVKTWMADEIFSSLNTFYQGAEKLIARKFYFSMPVYRPFHSVAEQNEWMGRTADLAYLNYIADISTTSRFGEQIHDPLGGITLQQTGYVDTKIYLDGVREYLIVNGVYEEGRFVDHELEILENSVSYRNFTAGKIIFCQGVHNFNNRWFNHLPIISLKGELLTVQCDWKKNVILNRGVYLAPGRDAEEWRVGATYLMEDKNPGVTPQARAELTHKLNDLVRFPFTVSGQEWGFRPTTPDRRPILGAHHKYSPLIIFNGLGTKGVSLAPYFSEVLIRAMEKKGTISKQADVSRFN